MVHFQVGLRLPLDPAFVDFLIYVRALPAQIHPNAVRNVMSLIVLCRGNGIEFTHQILSLFFTPLRMVDNFLSLRSRKNRVVLFNPLPNRVDWKGKWLAVESRIRFPFRPLVGYYLKWDSVCHNSKLKPSEKRFLEMVSSTLGDEPQNQTKVYSTLDLLSLDNLA